MPVIDDVDDLKWCLILLWTGRGYLIRWLRTRLKCDAVWWRWPVPSLFYESTRKFSLASTRLDSKLRLDWDRCRYALYSLLSH